MIVADTNLLVYLCLPGEHTGAAEQVLLKDPAWAAPLVWRSEFRNVLALYLRRGLLELDTTLDAFAHAESTVRGREYTVETARVLEMVEGSRCSAYDCEFVVLAEDLSVPLVTTDAALLRTFPERCIHPTRLIANDAARR